MNASHDYRVFYEQQQGGELTVRLAGVSQQELRHRLLRLGCYLRVLSDPEFRQFGQALVAAAGEGQPSTATAQPEYTPCPFASLRPLTSASRAAGPPPRS